MSNAHRAGPMHLPMNDKEQALVWTEGYRAGREDERRCPSDNVDVEPTEELPAFDLEPPTVPDRPRIASLCAD